MYVFKEKIHGKKIYVFKEKLKLLKARILKSLGK